MEAQDNVEEIDREWLQWVESHDSQPLWKEHPEISCEICYTVNLS